VVSHAGKDGIHRRRPALGKAEQQSRIAFALKSWRRTLVRRERQRRANEIVMFALQLTLISKIADQ